MSGFGIINSFILSIWWVYFMPKLHMQNNVNYNDRRSWCSVLICFLMFNMFFYGLSIYPLSDLFAIVLCSIGIIILLQIEKECEWKKCIILSFGLGCMLYFAYNVRTIYLFSGIYMLVRFWVWIVKSSYKLWKKMLLLCVNICGVLVASLPQLYMNYKQLGIISIKVPTNGLMLKQIYWGIRYQRYDTYIGLEERIPQMYFVDPVGSALLAKEGIVEFSDWWEFFLFAIRYPCEIIGIYVKHIVNVLLPCWSNLYVTDVDNNKIFLGFIWYVCIFLFGVAVCNQMIKGKVLYNYIALLVPVIFILPGAVEIRFVAALYIMVIGSLCYNIEWRSMKEYVSVNKVKLIVGFCTMGGLLLAIWTNMLASESINAVFMN